MQFIELLIQLVCIDVDLIADEDLLVVGLCQTLFIHQQLLIELLTGAQSRELDLHITVRYLAVHADQIFGEGGDLDGIAHIKDEDLAAVGDRTGFQHQRYRLGDGHEVAYDVGVGDGDGSARLDLSAEQRDDGTV